jgi:hypothetical protein
MPYTQRQRQVRHLIKHFHIFQVAIILRAARDKYFRHCSQLNLQLLKLLKSLCLAVGLVDLPDFEGFGGILGGTKHIGERKKKGEQVNELHKELLS